MFIIAIYFCSAFLSVYCQTGQNAKDLTDYLFVKNYNKKVRPRLNQTEAIEVKVGLTLLSIDGLSEASETFTTTGYLGITWKDEFLTWNKKEFGGIDFYRWPQVDVWKPDIVLLNSHQGLKLLGDDSLLLEVNANGTIVWYPYQVFQSTCTVDVRYFPFDSQTCELRFGAWSYNIWEVHAQTSGTGINLDSCGSKSDWDVQPIKYSSEEVDGTSAVTFSFKLTRKPLYVLLTIFMPAVLLSILDILVFILPCGNGEKAGYAITVFFAFAVFLAIVFPTLPRSSDTVAIFSVFLIILIVQSTLITAISLILIRCYSFEDKKPVPKTLQWFLQIITCSVCQVKQKVKPVEYRIFVMTDQVTEMFDFKNNKKEDNKFGGKRKQKAGLELTWKEAVEKLDRICLPFFLFTFLVSLGVCTYFGAFHR